MVRVSTPGQACLDNEREGEDTDKDKGGSGAGAGARATAFYKCCRHIVIHMFALVPIQRCILKIQESISSHVIWKWLCLHAQIGSTTVMS